MIMDINKKYDNKTYVEEDESEFILDWKLDDIKLDWELDTKLDEELDDKPHSDKFVNVVIPQNSLEL